MTKEELENQYPELCAELRAEAVSQERARVCRHLDFGAKGITNGPNAYRRAHKAIRSGEGFSPALLGEYMEEMMRARFLRDWQDDCDAAGRVLEGAARIDTTQLDRESLADALDRLQGV